MVSFICIQILIEHSVCRQWVPDQMPRSAASDLGLHCFPMSHKKDAMLIWLNVKNKKIVFLHASYKRVDYLYTPRAV